LSTATAVPPSFQVNRLYTRASLSSGFTRPLRRSSTNSPFPSRGGGIDSVGEEIAFLIEGDLADAAEELIVSGRKIVQDDVGAARASRFGRAPAPGPAGAPPPPPPPAAPRPPPAFAATGARRRRTRWLDVAEKVND